MMKDIFSKLKVLAKTIKIKACYYFTWQKWICYSHKKFKALNHGLVLEKSIEWLNLIKMLG